MAARALEPFGHPLFRRFFAGQAVSRLGDFVFFIALPWQVILLGGGPEQIGFALTAFLGAQFGLSLVGGALVDRLPRRSVVVASDVGQGLLVAAMAALSLGGGLTFEAVVAMAAAFGGAQAVAMPAIGAFLPETVPESSVPAANAIFQTALIAASGAGAVVAGGLLEAVGPWAAFAADAFTFAVSATLLATVRTPGLLKPPEERGGSLLGEVRAGWSYVAGVPWIWMAILIFAFFNAVEAAPRNVLLPVFVGVDLGGGASGFAAVNAVFMGGWLVGALLLVVRPAVGRIGLVAYSGVLVTAATTALVGLAGSPWAVAGLLAVQGLAFGVIGTLWQQAFVTFVDPRMRGRVISIDVLGSLSLMPVATAVVGSAALAVGVRTVFMFGGVVMGVLALVGLMHRGAREFGPAPADGAVAERPDADRPPGSA